MGTLMKIALRPLMFLVYLISGVIPRDRLLWVFGSYGGRFADNSKSLFLHCSSDRSNPIHCVWISRNSSTVKTLNHMGLPAYHAYSLQGLWYTLRAGVWVFDAYVSDINFWTSRGASKVNLWHGLPLKKVERDIDDPNSRYYQIHHGSFFQKLSLRLFYPWLSETYDMVISTSEYVSRVFASAFGITYQRVPVTGFPRNDVLFKDTEDALLGSNAYYHRITTVSQAGKRVIAYMPTFRDNAESGCDLPFNWEELDEFLQVRSACLFLKLHTNDCSALPGEHYRNVFVVPSETDFYPILRLVDVLITDYSSIYFDYLFIDRPVVIYTYDLEEYKNRNR